MTTPQAAAHRRRARSLRVLADTIETMPLMQLDSLASTDTWRGSRPFRSVAELRAYQHRMHADAERLRGRAWWLEQQADDLDRAAALAGIA